MATGPTIAAIDCGTNSTRLLVADAEGRPLERLMRITRLGQGVDATGRLAPDWGSDGGAWPPRRRRGTRPTVTSS
jgi:hypothetical protein